MKMLCYLYKDKRAKKEVDQLCGILPFHDFSLQDTITLLLRSAKEKGIEYNDDYYIGVIKDPIKNNREIRKTVKEWNEIIKTKNDYDKV